MPCVNCSPKSRFIWRQTWREQRGWLLIFVALAFLSGPFLLYLTNIGSPQSSYANIWGGTHTLLGYEGSSLFIFLCVVQTFALVPLMLLSAYILVNKAFSFVLKPRQAEMQFAWPISRSSHFRQKFLPTLLVYGLQLLAYPALLLIWAQCQSYDVWPDLWRYLTQPYLTFCVLAITFLTLQVLLIVSVGRESDYALLNIVLNLGLPLLLVLALFFQQAHWPSLTLLEQPQVFESLAQLFPYLATGLSLFFLPLLKSQILPLLACFIFLFWAYFNFLRRPVEKAGQSLVACSYVAIPAELSIAALFGFFLALFLGAVMATRVFLGLSIAFFLLGSFSAAVGAHFALGGKRQGVCKRAGRITLAALALASFILVAYSLVFAA